MAYLVGLQRARSSRESSSKFSKMVKSITSKTTSIWQVKESKGPAFVNGENVKERTKWGLL